MPYIMVVNKANIPLHGALSWNNIQQQYFNDLAVGQSYSFVIGLGWHDLPVEYSDADIRAHHVQVEELNTPYGYTVTMSGNVVIGTFDDASNTIPITKITPLVLHWYDRRTLGWIRPDRNVSQVIVFLATNLGEKHDRQCGGIGRLQRENRRRHLSSCGDSRPEVQDRGDGEESHPG
jgi:hypothetical protein